MIPYFLVYGWILMISGLLYIKKIEYQKARKWFCIGAFTAVILLFGLRHPFMGADLRYGESIGYLGVFSRMAQATWQEVLEQNNLYYYEKGYILFNRLISFFSDEHQMLIAACAVISIAPVGYTIYKESKQPDLAILIFLGLPVYMTLFSALRQAIAVGICALALLWIIRKKPVWFLLTVGLAMTFHKSAAVFLVAYPVYHVKLNKPLRWCSCAVPALVYLFREPIFALVGKVYRDYAVPDYNGSYRLFVMFCLIYLFCCIFSDERKEICGLKNLFLIACCVQALAGMHSVVMRMGYYFTIPLVLLLPLVMETMKNKKLAVFFKVAVSCCFIVFGLYLIRSSTWARAYPYFTFWEW